MCNNSCNECSRKIYSSSVTVGTAAGSPALIINVPEQSFRNGQRGCIVITQTIPDTATINMPVFITIGTDTTAYPVVSCNCSAVVACQLRVRRRYPFTVQISGVNGTFKILKNLSCSPCNNDGTIPAPTPAAGG